MLIRSCRRTTRNSAMFNVQVAHKDLKAKVDDVVKKLRYFRYRLKFNYSTTEYYTNFRLEANKSVNNNRTRRCIYFNSVQHSQELSLPIIHCAKLFYHSSLYTRRFLLFQI